MSLPTLRLAAQRLHDDGLAGPELTVVWHAGEPLVLPPAWYEEAFHVLAQALPGVALTHAMQSNATLIDDAWCSFFLRHGVALGVSVDGPAAMHDACRRTRRGAGTHAAVMAGMARLREHGVPFHAIAVVGSASLAEPDAFYDWFAGQGVRDLGCNFDEAEGPHRASSLAGHEAAHARFLSRLLQRSLSGPVRVRELGAAWRHLQQPLPLWHWRGEAWPQNTQVQPLALLTVGHDGGFSTFSPELLGQAAAGWGGFVIGHVQHGGYLQALGGAAFQRQWRAVRRGLQRCREGCAYFEVCGGGAPVNKFYEHGSFDAGETLHCRSMVQRPFDAVLALAEQQLRVREQAA